MIKAVRNTAEHSNQALAPGVLIEASWEGYGYLLYAMASSNLPLHKISETPERQHVYFHRYNLGGVEVRLVHCILRDLDRKEIVTKRIDDGIEEGFQIFLPTESVGLVFDISKFGTDIKSY